MTIEYSLDENDFLTYQLYTASRSQKIIKKRKRNKITVSIFYGAIAVLFLSTGSPAIGFCFLFCGLLWWYYFPKWERKNYIKHYRRFIKENFQDHVGVKSILEFQEDFILGKDANTESKIETSEIKEVVELPSHMVVSLKSGTFIIPKSKIPSIDEFRQFFKDLAGKINFKYRSDTNWEWK